MYKLPIRRPPRRDFVAQVTSWQHQRPPTQPRLITRWLIPPPPPPPRFTCSIEEKGALCVVICCRSWSPTDRPLWGQLQFACRNMKHLYYFSFLCTPFVISIDLAVPYRLAHLLSYGGVVLILIFILPGGCLNFSALVMKNVLFEEIKIKQCNERHWVESKTLCSIS